MKTQPNCDVKRRFYANFKSKKFEICPSKLFAYFLVHTWVKESHMYAGSQMKSSSLKGI